MAVEIWVETQAAMIQVALVAAMAVEIRAETQVAMIPGILAGVAMAQEI